MVRTDAQHGVARCCAVFPRLKPGATTAQSPPSRTPARRSVRIVENPRGGRRIVRPHRCIPIHTDVLAGAREGGLCAFVAPGFNPGDGILRDRGKRWPAPCRASTAGTTGG